MNSPLRIWLTGATGQLGTALQRLFPSSSSHIWLTKSRAELDLTELDKVALFIENENPDLIINAAAYTAVDRAESEQEIAFRLNAELPELLAKSGKPLVHISTDHVFGSKAYPTATRPYREADALQPVNYYGKTKAEGEARIRQQATEYYIFRTSWLYGPMAWGASFYKSIRTNALEGSPIQVVTDEVGTPTSTFTLARLLMATIQKLSTTAPLPFGTYHASDLGETSRFLFAQEILALDPQTAKLPCRPCLQKDRPSPALRPHYSALDTQLLQSYFPSLFKPWKQALREIYQLENNNL